MLAFACELLLRISLSFQKGIEEERVFALPAVTSNHVLSYRLCKRLSPASPNHFYPVCRDSSRVVKSLQSRDRDRTEECFFFPECVCERLSVCS